MGSHRRRARARTLALALIVLGSAPSSARAAPEDPIAQRVERLAAEAASAYHGADYQRAVELLERAYQMRQVGALLYNLAKAYEKLGDQDKTIEYYRRYVDSTEAEPGLRTKAAARIAAYEAAVAKKKAETKPPAHVEQPPPPHDNDAERIWREGRSRARGGGIALATLAVACAGAGAGLWGAALVLHKDYANRLGLETDKRAERDKGRTESIIGDSLWGVAAVAAGVGTYLLWRGYHHEKPPGVALAPLLSPTAGGLVATGVF